MKLSNKGLENRSAWEQAGYGLPEYDRQAMTARTEEAPFWLHFGAGNIFRAFLANAVQKLLNEKILDRGLLAVANEEVIEKLHAPHDDLSILATLKSDGSVEKTVVGSIARFLPLDTEGGLDSLRKVFAKDSLQMVSFTITEKAYNLTDGSGVLLPDVAKDLRNGPVLPHSYLGKVAALLYARYEAGEKPVAMVSMDNCSHNGDKLRGAVRTFAAEWAKNGLVSGGFLDYVENAQKVSFPWTMIDKITPRPNASVKAMLEQDGVEDLEGLVTAKGSYASPFVNAEECEYLVIEDNFPNGRPALERAGLIFTDRETVDKVEKMKVCTCLNPLHTALAVFGCLLGYDLISKEMEDETLRKLVEIIGYEEGLPVVVDPGILDPREFIDTVLNVRIPNPFMPDTPQRIATDTSQKLPIRYGETIKAYVRDETRDVLELKCIPLVFAGWLRYVLAVDDQGNAFEPSSDPMMETVQAQLAGVKLGDTVDESVLRPILSNEKIFGVDLYEVGLAERVTAYFKQMLTGPEAVRQTLNAYV